MDNTISMDDFSRAHNKAKMQSILSTLRWNNPELLSFYDVTKLVKPKRETYIGVKPIKVDKILGSENRYHDFSQAFFPKRYELRQRWENVDNARVNDIILPPISVYKLGDYFFVRDGNHRVSVAKAMGVEFIDAEIVELDSQIPLHAGMTLREIGEEVVSYERKQFLQTIKSPENVPLGEIRFSKPGMYPELANHILVHKYYMNMEKEDEIPMDEAVEDWYKKVYFPIISEIREEHMLRLFPGKTEGDLYMWVVRHWDDLKHEHPGQNIPIKEAGEDYVKQNSSGRLKRWLVFLKGRLSRH